MLNELEEQLCRWDWSGGGGYFRGERATAVLKVSKKRRGWAARLYLDGAFKVMRADGNQPNGPFCI